MTSESKKPRKEIRRYSLSNHQRFFDFDNDTITQFFLATARILAPFRPEVLETRLKLINLEGKTARKGKKEKPRQPVVKNKGFNVNKHSLWYICIVPGAG